MAFTAADVRVSAVLPRKWEGKASVHVTADGPLPDGWRISIWLDDDEVAAFGALPVEVPLDLSALKGPKHRIWIGMLDKDGEAVGRAERIFRLGRSGVLG
jgi:hypothetical protein